MLESKFKTELVEKLEYMFPGCVILRNDPNLFQGIPDLLILFETKWAMLEGKRSSTARIQPNQEYWVDYFNHMSFAAFIFPENENEVLNALQQTFRAGR